MRFAWVLVAGCSWTMSMQGPTWDAQQVPTCTESLVPPVFDGVVAAAATTLFIALVTDGLIWKHGCGGPNQYGEHPCGTILPEIAASGGAGALVGYASYDGFRSYSRCHRRYDEYAASGHKVDRNHGSYAVLGGAMIVVGAVVGLVVASAAQSFHL